MNDVVKEVKQTIKELQKEHKGNLKYRPYAQDISYALKKKGYGIPTHEVANILRENNIKIPQPKDPLHDPQSQKLVQTKGK